MNKEDRKVLNQIKYYQLIIIDALGDSILNHKKLTDSLKEVMVDYNDKSKELSERFSDNRGRLLNGREY